VCDANVMSYNQEKLVFEQDNPETPGLRPETPDNVSGVSGRISGVSGPSGQNTEK
jgi:hypothetical protein